MSESQKGKGMSDQITVENVLGRERANNVLNWFDSSKGYAGGGFFAALMSAAARADDQNLNRLAEGFPAEIAAYRLATRDPEGLRIIERIAQ